MMTNLNKIDIVVDCDNILLNYTKAFCDWVTKNYNYVLKDESHHTSYNMGKWFQPEMNLSTFKNLIHEFNSYPRCIHPVKGSQEAVKRLKAAGYSMVVVTSFGGSVGSSEFRKDYLNMLYPDCFEDVIILGLGECKKDILEKINPDYFIDDYDGHLESGLSLNICSIGLREPYNGDTDAIYLDNWNEILYIISEKDYLKEVI